jgi:hypothetical protein
MNVIHGFPIFQDNSKIITTTDDASRQKMQFLRIADFISTNSEDTLNLASQKISFLKKAYPGNEHVIELERVFKAFLLNVESNAIPTSENVQNTMRSILKLVSDISKGC